MYGEFFHTGNFWGSVRDTKWLFSNSLQYIDWEAGYMK